MRCEAHQVIRRLSLVLLSLVPVAVPRVSAGQQRGSITVSVNRVIGTGGKCSATAMRTTAGQGLPMDTVVVKVVADTGTDARVKTPLTLILLRDAIPVDSLLPSADTILYTAVSTPAVVASYSVRPRGGRDICSLALAATEPPLADTSVHARQATADSLERMGQYRRAEETGNSFVILSLIKSISGEIPNDEFFDIRMKFGRASKHYDPLLADSAQRSAAALRVAAQRAADRYAITKTPEDSAKRAAAEYLAKSATWRANRMTQAFSDVGSRIFSFASIDVALSTRVDTGKADTVTNRRLADAQLSLNYIVVRPSSRSIIPDRIGYVGGIFKVFDTRSFLGVQYGGLELRGSRLEGTSVQVAYLRRLYADSVLVAPGVPAGTNTPAKDPEYATLHNRNYAYVEFYIRVPRAQMLDRLRVRGGLLMPIGSGVRERTSYRVTLSVPIVDLTRF